MGTDATPPTVYADKGAQMKGSTKTFRSKEETPTVVTEKQPR